jgi:hypothetical protein
MVSAGYEGTVYEWSLDDEKKRLHENIVKTCSFRCIVYDDETQTSAAIGNDKRVWSFRESAMQIEIPTKDDLHAMCLSKTGKTLFVGTHNGKILLYKWPLNDFHYREYHVHTGAVVMLQLSYEERFLFSTGADGSMFMLELDSILDGKRIVRKTFDYEICEDLYFTQRSHEEERETLMKELENKLTQIQNEYERKLQLRAEKHEEEMRKAKEQLTDEIKILKEKITSGKIQASDQEALWKEKESQLESAHYRAADHLQQQLDKGMHELKEKYEKMINEKNNALSEYIDQLVKVHKEHNLQLEQQKFEKESMRMELTQQLNELKDDFIKLKEYYDKTTKMKEEDFMTEMGILTSKLNEDIQKRQQVIDKERGLAALNGAKVEDKDKQIRERKREIMKLQYDIKVLQKQREDDRVVIESLTKDLNARQELISTNEKKLLEYDKQATELESIRYVLTYKYKQLSDVVTPKEELIKDMREKLKGTDSELQRVRQDTDNLLAQITTKNEKAELLQKNVTKYKQIADDKHRLINSLLRDLSELAGAGDPKLTNIQLKKLVTKYSTFLLKSVEAEKTEKDQLQEFERQREFMEQSMHGLKKNMTQREVHLKADLGRKNNENSILVEEINQLRKDQKKHKQRIVSLEAQLKTALCAQPIVPNALQEEEAEPPLVPSLPSSRPQSTGNVSRRSLSSSRPVTRGSVTSTGLNLSRIRTPDSFFSVGSRGSSRGTGRVVLGPTPAAISSHEPTVKPSNGFIVNRDLNTSLDRAKVAEFVASLNENTKKFEEQQEQIGKLKDYVHHLLKSTTKPMDDGSSTLTTHRDTVSEQM